MKIIKYLTWPRSGCQFTIWALLKYCSGNVHYPLNKDGEKIYEDFILSRPHRRSLNEMLRKYDNNKSIHSVNSCYFAEIQDLGGNLQAVVRAKQESLKRKIDFFFLHAHDLGSDSPDENDSNIKYIIQYRNPILCAISYLSWSTNPDKQYSKGVVEWITKQTKLWKTWVRQWAINKKNCSNFLMVEYSQLVENSSTELRRIIEFVGYDWNPTHFENVLKFAKINHKHTVKDFDLYGVYTPFLYEIQDSVEEELEILQLPKLKFNKEKK